MFVVLVTGIIERKRLQYESIIAIAIRSIFLDAWIYEYLIIWIRQHLWEIQWLYFMFGIISMGIGIGIYMETHFPKSPIDGLMLAIHQRFQWSINTSRIIVELSGAVIGFLLGGPVGLGTLLIALVVGKVIQMMNRKIKKVLQLEGLPVSQA